MGDCLNASVNFYDQSILDGYPAINVLKDQLIG